MIAVAKKRSRLEVAAEAAFILDPICLGPEYIPDDVRAYLIQALNRGRKVPEKDIAALAARWDEVGPLLARHGEAKEVMRRMGWEKDKLYRVVAAARMAKRIPMV